MDHDEAQDGEVWAGGKGWDLVLRECGDVKMKKVKDCLHVRWLVMPVLVAACGFAAGCTADTCPTVEVQHGENDTDPELLKDCEGEEEDGPAGTEDAPKVEEPGAEPTCECFCDHGFPGWLCPTCNIM